MLRNPYYDVLSIYAKNGFKMHNLDSIFQNFPGGGGIPPDSPDMMFYF